MEAARPSPRAIATPNGGKGSERLSSLFILPNSYRNENNRSDLTVIVNPCLFAQPQYLLILLKQLISSLCARWNGCGIHQSRRKSIERRMQTPTHTLFSRVESNLWSCEFAYGNNKLACFATHILLTSSIHWWAVSKDMINATSKCAYYAFSKEENCKITKWFIAVMPNRVLGHEIIKVRALLFSWIRQTLIVETLLPLNRRTEENLCELPSFWPNGNSK